MFSKSQTRDREYVEIIQQLPPPTPAQTALFATYVSEAHSWYKHLPLDPKVPFYFYLDPHAGKNLVRTQTGEVAMLEITDESNRFHYTWQTTRDYRSRFGFWAYHANYGNAFAFASDGGVVNTRGSGKFILSRSGEWIEVPPVLQEIGQVYLSAVVHPYCNLSIWSRKMEKFGLSELFEVDAPDLPKPLLDLPKPFFRRLWGLLLKKSELIQEKAQLSEHHVWDKNRKCLLNLLEEKKWLNFRSRTALWEKNELLLRLAKELKLTDALFPSLLEEVERIRITKYLDRFSKDLKESPEVLQIFQALREERLNQLSAMNKAMNRVLQAIYGTG